MAKRMGKCVIVGGGLAGLISARNLASAGWNVTILEKDGILGGKARADEHPNAPVLIEHGYHVFPQWYTNIRRLLDELNEEIAESQGCAVADLPPQEKLRLVDLDGYHYLTPERKFYRIFSPFRTGDTPLETARLTAESMRVNLFEALKPWYVQYLFLMSVVDILRRPFTDRMMDSVSQVGFLRGKRYATESLALLNQENMLKASAIPAYEMSAMTAHNVGGYWVRQPQPFLSVLPGDLQTCFIDPIVRSCERHGVSIKLNQEVGELSVDNAADGKPYVSALRDRHGQVLCTLDEDDRCIVTTPLEVTRWLITEDVYRADPELGNMEHLETEPMSALHLFVDLSSQELGIEGKKEHVFLTGSHYGLSFIDNTQVWEPVHRGDQGWTYLSFISSNFSPLRAIKEPEQRMALLLEEIQQYLPALKRETVKAWYLNDNFNVPLYINTVGSWRKRPRVDCAIPNLYFAGDYVKNPIDLACMEGAVYSAMEAAHCICAEAPVPEEPVRYPELSMRLLYLALRMSPMTWLAIALAKRGDRKGPSDPKRAFSWVKIAATEKLRGKGWLGPLSGEAPASSEREADDDKSGAFRTARRSSNGAKAKAR